MVFRDLREWLAKVDELGELSRISGASWQEEIGVLTGLKQKEMGSPALLFDDIPGYPSGFRVLSNSTSSLRRVAMSLNQPVDATPETIVRNWRQFLREWKPIPPRVVANGPVLTNRMTGDAVDLERFPSPIWHEDDGGRYIGTGCMVVTRDPDDGHINCGAYRVQVHDSRRAGLLMVTGRHGDLMRSKYWERGQAMPVAVSVGHDPLFYMVGGLEVPLGISEYEYTGAIRSEPVEVVETPIHKLKVPAGAEIVIEGEVAAGDSAPEGPFGEWTGYYASGVKDTPVIRVQAIYYRDNPIILGAIPDRPPCDINYYRTFLRSAMIWDQLEGAGVQGVQGVWAHPVGGGRMLHVISVRQLYPGHVQQVGTIAAQCQAAAYVNKMVVVVDDDIDIYNTNEVLWALLTRVDPDRDLTIMRRSWTSKVDPTSYVIGDARYTNRMVIDACRPWEQRSTFPPTIQISRAAAQRVMDRWPELFRCRPARPPGERTETHGA